MASSLRRGRLSAEKYEERLSAYHTRSARQIYDAVLRLQGLMIKIGQTIGSRPDTFPEEYVRVLSRLQDQVPPRSWASMRPHIERQLGAPIEEIFAEFDTQPVAAASLAQVYKGRLKDGRQVAVKAVYPNIERMVDTDLKLLRAVIWLESRLLYSFPLEPAFQELAANIPLEVDMKVGTNWEQMDRYLPSEHGTWHRLEKTAAQVAAEEADEELEAIPAIAV